MKSQGSGFDSGVIVLVVRYNVRWNVSAVDLPRAEFCLELGTGLVRIDRNNTNRKVR